MPREIEIWFVEADGRLYVLAEHGHKAHWVHNTLLPTLVCMSVWAIGNGAAWRACSTLTRTPRRTRMHAGLCERNIDGVKACQSRSGKFDGGAMFHVSYVSHYSYPGLIVRIEKVGRSRNT
jgi:hypothetical protein